MGDFPYIEEGAAVLGYRKPRALMLRATSSPSVRLHLCPPPSIGASSSMYAEWIFQRGVSFSNLVNYVPVAATVVTTLLSLVLARATLRYVDAADKSLKLAREQFDREWSPELHVRLERISTTDAKIIVTNLGKSSVLLQLLQLRQISHAAPFERCFLNEPVVGGMTWTEHVGDRLLGVTEDDFEGTISASVTFYASGRMFRSDWFRFKIQVCDG